MSKEKVRPDLAEHANLIRQFVDHEITAAEFESRYLQLVKNDKVIHGKPAFGIIDELFYYVDEYFDDPDASDAERDLEVTNLRGHAREALERIRQVSGAGW
ncbi:MAG TPA: colicin immunity domain-containing protein [Pseudonocardiaceae bacterium]